jgi:hypothetical protein
LNSMVDILFVTNPVVSTAMPVDLIYPNNS